MTRRYQVVGALAAFTVTSEFGAQKITLYKGDFVPGGVPRAEIDHHLDVKLIAEMAEGEEIPAGTGPLGTETHRPPEGNALAEPVERSAAAAAVSPTLPQAERAAGADSSTGAAGGNDLQTRLDAAKQELPDDGSAPQPAAKKDVQAAWLAGKGYAFAELTKQNKDELVKLVGQVKQQSA